jgi:hypothetical protein
MGQSIYQQALGSDFARLHPEIQRRFGFSSADGVASVGRGVMEEVWKGAFYTVPFLYVGEHLAVDIELAVDDEGGLRLRSGAQRFYEGPVGFTFPMGLSGVADVREWYDERAGRFRIRVDVRNRRWGRLFGYQGSFDVEWRRVGPGGVPSHVLPARQEQRE